MKIKFLILFSLFAVMSCSSTVRFSSGSDKTVIVNGKFRGYASYYGEKFHGRKTASGEIYDMNQLTAAHKELPFGTKLKVTNLKNGMSVFVKVNDRGPFVSDRILDLSKRAAETLKMLNDGVVEVECEIIE